MQASQPPKDRLGPRLLVAFLGIPALLAVTWLGGWPFALLVLGVVLIGLWEYLQLLPHGQLTPRPVPVFLAGLVLWALFAQHAGVWGVGQPLSGLPLHFIATIFLLVMVLQAVEVLQSTANGWMNVSANVLGVLWIAGFGSSFILVRSATFYAAPISSDPAFRLTVALYASVWICDSFAYLFGRRYGKRKILPLVSPNKTVVGTVAGAAGALATMLALGFGGWLPSAIFATPSLLVLGLIAGVAGQMGDFVESRLKRDFGVKDSGRLLPGHGGVLDRFDSLLFVMPLTYLYLVLIVQP